MITESSSLDLEFCSMKFEKKEVLDNSKVLTSLLVAGRDNCPHFSAQAYLDDELIDLASQNKMAHYLFHFLSCQNCKKLITSKELSKKLSRFQKAKFILDYFSGQETLWLERELKKQKIRFVYFKKKEFYPKLKTWYPDESVGMDIDLLLARENIIAVEHILQKRGYTYLHKAPQEVTYRHEQHRVSFDLHFLIAIPREGIISTENLEQLSRQIYITVLKNKVTYLPPTEYLISMVTRFWCNDFLRGLRSLYDIYAFSEAYAQFIDWKRVAAAERKLGLVGLHTFTIYLAHSRFSQEDIQLQRIWKQLGRPTFMMKFLCSYFNVERITTIKHQKHWWNLGHPYTQKLFQEIYFTKLLITPNMPFWRLFRPKIFIFVCRVILSSFTI